MQKNDKLAIQEFKDTLAGLLYRFASSCSQEIFSDQDLVEVQQIVDFASDTVPTVMRNMLSQIEERARNLSRQPGMLIVSLGDDCFGRAFPTYYGLKPPAALGEKTHPFDIAEHSIATVAHLISSNFSGYIDSENLKYSVERNRVENPKFAISFVHEVGAKYAENDFKLLKEIYHRRVSNMLSDIELNVPPKFADMTHP